MANAADDADDADTGRRRGQELYDRMQSNIR